MQINVQKDSPKTIRVTKRCKRAGLTPKEFEDLVALQKGECAICKIFRGRKLHIDHDHDSGLIRGLLCSKCNTGLGSLGDNEDGLLRALDYLRRTKI